MIRNVEPGQIRNIVIICNRASGGCGCYNETLD
jgi:predicted transcriptional regulator